MVYNANMGSVDKQDQVLQPYSIARKTMKWYKKNWRSIYSTWLCWISTYCIRRVVVGHHSWPSNMTLQ